VRTDYAHSEAQHRFGKDPRNYSLLSKSFLAGDQGEVRAVQTVEVDWTRPDAKAPFTEVEGSEQEWPCDLVFLSMGFTGPEQTVVDEFDLECDPRSNIQAGAPSYQSSRLPIFAAGDCRRGQSLVVWAIHEGREVAQAVDEYLRKRSQMPAVA
jgi:glutamate synthase (NADPH/NADH) small chain